MRVKRMTGILLVLCVMLALGNAAALAVDWEAPVSLTVRASDNFADEAEAADFAEAEVVVDLYKVASVAAVTDEAGEPVNVDSFDLLYSTEPYSELDPAADWDEQAAEAARLTMENDVEPTIAAVPIGGTVGAEDGLTQGLYLVIAHGANDEEYVTADGNTIARSRATEFTFAPQLITLPTKNDVNEDGEITTAGDDGDWVYAGDLMLKYSAAARFGTLTIQKTVAGFEGQPAIFVFHIVDTATGGTVYDNYASIYFTGGSAASEQVLKVPAGVELTVSEEYSGGRYTLTSANDQTVTVSAADGGAVSFTNTRNDSGVGGNGINNNFTYDGSDWPLTATPAQG